jgi:hypothetical protein
VDTSIEITISKNIYFIVIVLHDSNVKKLKNLTDKLEHEGTCPCGKRMKAREWLIHIFARDTDGNFACEYLRKKKAENAEVNPIESRI